MGGGVIGHLDARVDFVLPGLYSGRQLDDGLEILRLFLLLVVHDDKVLLPVLGDGSSFQAHIPSENRSLQIRLVLITGMLTVGGQGGKSRVRMASGSCREVVDHLTQTDLFSAKH